MKHPDGETVAKTPGTLMVEGASPFLENSENASIVIISTTAALEKFIGAGSYNAMKAALLNYSGALSQDLGPKGIRVNVVVPGPTRTKMTERPGYSEEDYNAAYGNYPLGRMAEAREIAEVVVFLASDESSFCTGGDFVVDGGVTVGKPRA